MLNNTDTHEDCGTKYEKLDTILNSKYHVIYVGYTILHGGSHRAHMSSIKIYFRTFLKF